ncbi:hypothetical protein HY489_04955 [Candidatus Woesearchaeota archaeon]|nr:hypothetical protein [Candidatus Woesearchaeota archaeon]
MEMSKQQLARIASNLLNELKQNKILDDLKTVAGKIYDDCVDDQHGGEEYVEIGKHPADATATVITYFRRTGQSPIQLVIRAQSIKIMITCIEELDGYEAFDEVPEFGKLQDKKLKDTKELLAELEKLAKLK